MNKYEKEYKAIKEKTELRKLLTSNKSVQLRSLGTLWYEIKCKMKNKLKNTELRLEGEHELLWKSNG